MRIEVTLQNGSGSYGVNARTRASTGVRVPVTAPLFAAY
jgi:hypothetical protein